ncbi:DUF4865 family protein [Actinoplanes utahensis]|uniref:DUF4865 family protein n=1 Tax=Actinoplanes utahensis TaxID=1869 RepID=UPI000AA1EAAE|nr:DUF4865 family protein [Actinoplanes utahensis]
MFAKQYEITLPADYDMGIIRKRVAVGGPLFDAVTGLGLKAFLMRRRGVAGAPVNEYAPFYLWHDAAAMTRFLVGGGGFQNIVRDFGSPRSPVACGHFRDRRGSGPGERLPADRPAGGRRPGAERRCRGGGRADA